MPSDTPVVRTKPLPQQNRPIDRPATPVRSARGAKPCAWSNPCVWAAQEGIPPWRGPRPVRVPVCQTTSRPADGGGPATESIEPVGPLGREHRTQPDAAHPDRCGWRPPYLLCGSVGAGTLPERCAGDSTARAAAPVDPWVRHARRRSDRQLGHAGIGRDRWRLPGCWVGSLGRCAPAGMDGLAWAAGVGSVGQIHQVSGRRLLGHTSDAEWLGEGHGHGSVWLGAPPGSLPAQAGHARLVGGCSAGFPPVGRARTVRLPPEPEPGPPVFRWIGRP